MSAANLNVDFRRSNKHLAKNEQELFEAVFSNNSKVVTRLLDAGVNVNVKINDGYIYDQTALMIACKASGQESVKLLLDAGADANCVTRSESKGVGNLAALHFIMRSLNEQFESKRQIANLLLQAGANPNQISNGGDTPLTYAANEGSLEMVKLLVEHDADMKLAGVIFSAVGRNDTVMLDYCFAKEAHVDSTAPDGLTPMLLACRRGHEKMVENLIARGAGLHKVTAGGANALTYNAIHASYDCRLEADCDKALRICKMLVKKGVKINPKDRDGLTPLDYASEAKDLRIAEYLKERGAKLGSDLQ